MGKAAERRFFEAVESADMRYPHWMNDVTPANGEQDRAGFDFSVGGDFGRVYINIKHADSAVANFEAREDRRLIPCIVVHPWDENRTVINKLRALVEKLRSEIFERRRLPAAE